MNPALGLAAARVLVGGVALAAPEAGSRLFRLDPAVNRQLPYMTRLFGSREVVLGAATLLASGSARRNLVLAGVGVDVADALAAVAAGRAGAVDPGDGRGTGRARRRRGRQRAPGTPSGGLGTTRTGHVGAPALLLPWKRPLTPQEHAVTQMPASPQQSPGPPSTGRPGELLDRFLARLVDFILLAIVNAVLVTFLVVGAVMGETGGFYGASSFASAAVSAVITAVITLGYFSFMEATRGQTVGKMVMKLQTFGPTGAHPTVEQAVRRNIWAGLGILGLVPVVGGIVGAIAQLVAMIMIAVGINNDPARRQAWHDQFAGGTYVLKVG